MDFQLQLFGAFSARNQTGQEIRFRDDKVRALLAYLAVERSQAHQREKLVEMFWGNASQERAKHSLRMALTRLRRALSDGGVQQPDTFLQISRQSVGLYPGPNRHWIDILEFETLALKCRDHPTGDLNGAPFVRDWMARAVSLYRGSFLAGLTLSDSPSFDDWLIFNQGRFEQQTLQFLDALGEDALENNQIRQAEAYAWRQLEISPWMESAHRQLMRVYAQQGKWQLVQSQYQKCVKTLKTELGADPEPETTALLEQLKQRAARKANSDRAARPQAIPTLPNNLPQAHTPFFGREAERARLIHALLDDGVALISVVGPGGAGKSRLTLDGVRHVLHHEAFQDGVWFVPLDGLRAGDENLYQAIAGTIAKPVGLELNPPARPHEQLFEYLKNRRMLLVLDNFEQLIFGENDGVDFVLDLIRSAAQVKLVVSSRRPLNLQMEAVIHLDGLPVPQHADDNAYSFSSVQLFAERVRRVNPSFSLTPVTLPDVVEICRFLDGMPLGLELIAVRMREMSIRQALHALNSNLDLLKTRLRDMPTRHQSMRAVFDWSWSLLSPEERRVTSELAVFRGGFSLEAAWEVCAAESELLYALIDHSLVRAGSGRYSLHELLRQFAWEQVEDIRLIQRKHSHYYLAFVEERADRLIRKDLVQATTEIEQEWENVQQAWFAAIDNQNIAGIRMAITGLGRYMRNSGMIWFGETLFRAAIDGLAQPEAQLFVLWQEAVAHLWLELARGYIWSAQYTLCIQATQRVIEIGEALGSAYLVAGGNLEWGRALWRLGEYRRSNEVLARNIPLPAGHAWLSVQTYNALGNNYTSLGKFDEATNHYQRAIELQKELGIWSNRVQVLNNLATIAAMRGEYEQAISLLSEVLESSHEYNQRYFQVTIFHNLGLANSEMGRYSMAEAYFRQALELSDQIQNRQNETDMWLGLAQLYRRLGQFQRGDEVLQKALELCAEFGEKIAGSEAMMNQALLSYARRDYSEASRLSQNSIELAENLGPTIVDMDIRIVSGYCHLALGDFAAAAQAFKAALSPELNLGNAMKEAEARAGLARVALKLGDRNTAIALLDKPMDCLETHGSFMGAVLPFDLYWMLYESFTDLADERANLVLLRAQALIHQQAWAIPDESARRTFLEQLVCAKILAGAP